MIKDDSFFVKKYKELRHKIKNLRNTNLEVGLCHYYMDNTFDAIMRFKLILRFSPDDADALYNLGRCYLKKSKPQQALDIFQKLSPVHKMAQYQCLKTTNPEDIQSIPSAVVSEKMHHLAIYKIYHGYENSYLQKLIINAIYKHCDTERQLQILELFCQNGFLGQAIKKRGIDCCIHGIDVSHVATEYCDGLQIKNQKKVYDATTVTSPNNLLDFEADDKTYDLILSDESLSYRKNIYAIFKKIRQLLSNNGVLMISCFNAEGSDVELDEINDHFCFSQKQIEKAAEQTGLTICDKHDSKNTLFTDGRLTLYIIKKQG